MNVLSRMTPPPSSPIRHRDIHSSRSPKRNSGGRYAAGSCSPYNTDSRSPSSRRETTRIIKFSPRPDTPELSPLELRWLNKSTGRASQSDVALHDAQKGRELLVRGLKGTSENVVEKFIRAKQATRETRRHRVLTLAWELEEAQRHVELLKAVETDCHRAYSEASEDAEYFENMLSTRGKLALSEDINFLHQAYEEDLSAFSACEEQLDQLEGYALNSGLAQLDPGRTESSCGSSSESCESGSESCGSSGEACGGGGGACEKGTEDGKVT